jgi:hypothetical protein
MCKEQVPDTQLCLPLLRRCLALAPVAIVLLAACVSADNIDLPVATSGFEKWAGVVGKALAFGGGDKDQTLQSLSSFQETVMQKMKSKARCLPRALPHCQHARLANLKAAGKWHHTANLTPLLISLL